MTLYLEVVLRTTVVYFFIIVVIRFFGKNQLTQLSVTDLVLIMLVSNSVQNAMVGSDSSLWAGLFSAGSLFILNFILKQVSYRNKTLHKIIEGNPVMLVHHGHLVKENMEREQISMEELETAAREHGVNGLTQVDLAVLENDGSISILSNDYHHRTNKKRKSSKTLPKST